MLQTLIKIQHLAEETSKQSVYGAYGLHPRGKKVIAYPVVWYPDRKAYRNIARWQGKGLQFLIWRFDSACSDRVAIPSYTIFSPQGIPAAVEVPF